TAPAWLRPQHHTSPASDTAQVWFSPAATSVASNEAAIGAGASSPSRVPRPSSPSRLSPQHHTSPLAPRAHVWPDEKRPPADTCVTPSTHRPCRHVAPSGQTLPHAPQYAAV